MQLSDADIEAFRNAMTTIDAAHASVAEAVETLSSLTDQAIALARQDSRQGLAMLDRLRAMCSGIPALAGNAAALGYNRAALLRIENRLPEAGDAYRAVVSEFESSDDPDVGFWVALALYNHITMVLEAGPEQVAAERVPPLAGKFRDLFGHSADPRILARVRYAMRAELELFQRLDRAEEAAASRARLEELVRPAVEVILAKLAQDDPPGPDSEAAPKWPLPREQLVTSLVVDIESCLDMAREVADADTAALFQMIETRPVLLSWAALTIFAAARDGVIPGAQGAQDSARIGRGLNQLLAALDYLHKNRGDYPLGSGPIESLLGAVDVSISMADALEYARSPDMVRMLSVPYVHGLAEASMSLLGQGQWRQASRLHLLLLAAAERVPDSREGRGLVTMARFRWLFVARQVLIHLPDARVLHSAADAGRRVLVSYEGQPGSERFQAETMLALAALYFEPYAGGRTSANYVADIRRWLARLREEVLDPVETDQDGPLEMPAFAEVVDISEDYVNRAMDLAEPVQRTHLRSLLLNIRRARSMLGQDIDHAELAGIAAQVASADDVDGFPQLLANALIVQWSTGQVPDEAALDRLLAYPLEEIAERSGQQAAHAILLCAGQVFAGKDPARGRRLLAQAQGFVRGLAERDRLQVLSIHEKLLLDASDVTTDDEFVPQESVESLLGRVTAESWPVDRAAPALITYFRLGLDSAGSAEAEDHWFDALQGMATLFPSFVEENEDVLGYLMAGSFTRASSRAFGRGDLAHALRRQAAACSLYLTMSAPDAAMESLTLIARIVAEADGKGLAQAAAGTLASIAVPAENAIGAAAADVLQTIWSQVTGASAWDGQAEEVFVCMQLAKGARFVDALRAGITFDARTDDDAARLLTAIGHAEDSPNVDLDAVTLVTPYSERLDAVGTMTTAAQRENLERTFDALVQRALTSHEAHTPRLMYLNTTCDLLPADAVLLFSHLTHTPGGGRSLVTLMISKDRVALVPNEILDADGAAQQLELHIDNRVRTFDRVAGTVFEMRQEVQAEPGPLRVIARSGEAALDDCLALFGPVADLLREEYAAGRRHLVIVPHGPLHFAPLHLLHLDGRPLAEAWTVTYLPNIALLERQTQPLPAGKTGMVAVGLGFADGSLPPIPEAVQEAEAVAAKFGSRALLDADATENAVFEALAGARLFHIATHGVHNVAAPAFQSLYVADERVSAHELLRLDLHGLELVTLSACETALGRFDAADNLRGIPAHLLLRGAGAVVGTLWPVESQTSRDFFTTLYEMLHDGSSKLDAFAAAQKQTRAAHPQYRDWGAFYYMGDWR